MPSTFKQFARATSGSTTVEMPASVLPQHKCLHLGTVRTLIVCEDVQVKRQDLVVQYVCETLVSASVRFSF